MKHACRHILPVIGLLLTILAACSDDRLTEGSGNDNSGSIRQEVYVSLTVAADGTGRSRTVGSPQPGENGDGPEDGTGNENVIADLNVFFFDAGTDNNGSRPSINAATDVAENTPVITFYTDQLLTVTLNGQTGYTTGSREITDIGVEMGKTYDVLVLANYGTNYGEEYADAHDGEQLTLAVLRDAVIEGEPYTEGANDSHVFESSTSRIIRDTDDGKRFVMASAGADVPALTVVPNTDITPVTASVTLERLAARVDYHVLPEYSVKVTEDPTAQTPTVREDLVKITDAVLCNDYTAAEYLFKRVTERTTDITDWSAEPVTYLGIERYGQQTGHVLNYVVDPKTASNDKVETDFLRYYLHHNAPYEEGWVSLTAAETDEDVNNPVYHCLGYTRENVAQVADGNRPGTALCVVFKAEYTPAKIDGADNTELKTFYWYHYKAYSTLEKLREENPNTVPNNLTDINLTDYGIHKYDNGTCYYTYYIRHADDGDINTDSPMEHATVRNNIYRLNVQSVSGPGGSGDIIVTVTPAPWRNDINVYPEF